MKTLRSTMTAGLLLCFAAIACGPSEAERLNANTDAVGSFSGAEGDGCTLTQGYWKNHPESWPTSALTIGGVTYSQAQLLKLFTTPPKGDASLILGHQLFAALLNGASGAGAPAEVKAAAADAEAWMAANKDADGALPYGVKKGPAAQEAIALADTLGKFNEGRIGPGHCEDGPPSGGGSGGAGGGTTTTTTGGGETTGSSGGTTTTGGGTTTTTTGGGGEACAPSSPWCDNIDLPCPNGQTCLAGCCIFVPR